MSNRFRDRAGYTRREILRLGAAAAASAMLPARGWPKGGSSTAPTFAFTPFERDLPIAPVLTPTALTPAPGTPAAAVGSAAVFHGIAPEFNHPPCPDWALFPLKTYQITMKKAIAQIVPGVNTEVFTYNGSVPGPTIVSRFREPVVVRQVNALDVEASVHLHGGHQPAHADGHPSFFVLPGKARDYYYPNIAPREGNGACGQPFDISEVPSTMWYHDHAMDITGFNVSRGLAAYYLIHDDLEDILVDNQVLPPIAGDFDIPLALIDQRLNPDGSLFYNFFDHDGRLGDIFTVNGVAQPKLHVQRRKYRFRILNASNARIYQLRLSTGQPFLVIGTDSWLLPAAQSVQDFTLGMAQRQDVIIDFSNAPNQLFLENIMQQTSGRGPDGIDPGKPTRLLKFVVDRAATTDLTITEGTVLRPHVAIQPGEIKVNRTFEFNRSNGAWQINSQFFSPRRADAVPFLGSAERWTFKNGGGGWWHPIHVHLEAHQVQTINGKAPPSHRRFKVDTTLLAGGDEAVVFMKFRTFTGPFVMHCHNVEHEDMRMMVNIDPRPEGKPSILDGCTEIPPEISGIPQEPKSLFSDTAIDVERLDGRGVGFPPGDFKPCGVTVLPPGP